MCEQPGGPTGRARLGDRLFERGLLGRIVPVPEVSAGPLRAYLCLGCKESGLCLATLSRRPSRDRMRPISTRRAPSRAIQTVRFAFPCPYAPPWHVWTDLSEIGKIILTDPPDPTYLTSYLTPQVDFYY